MKKLSKLKAPTKEVTCPNCRQLHDTEIDELGIPYRTKCKTCTRLHMKNKTGIKAARLTI
jgi:hypothetical protein